MSSHDEEYEVGYGKPPKEARFEKGRSGNPKGRPTGSRGIATMFNEITRELINVTESGKTKTMSRMEAVLRQLLNKALSGDQRAMREIVQLQRVFEATEAAEVESQAAPTQNSALFQNILKRVQLMAEKPPAEATEQTDL